MVRFYDVFLVFDVAARQAEIKRSLIFDHHFGVVISAGNNTECFLPQTTLYKRRTTTDAALQTLKNVCNRNYTSLVRAIALRVTEWTSVKGMMPLQLEKSPGSFVRPAGTWKEESE